MRQDFITSRPTFERLLQTPGTLLLDDQLEKTAPALLYGMPEKTLTCDQPQEITRFLNAVDAAVQEGYYVAGYLSYEAGYGFESRTFQSEQTRDYSQLLGYPLAWMGLYNKPQWVRKCDLNTWLPDSAPGFALQAELSKSQYEWNITEIRRRIAAGDMYQLNFTMGFESANTSIQSRPQEISPEATYALLRARQQVTYSAFLQLGNRQILSASPELFFKRLTEGAVSTITCKPMKGTLPRGCTEAVDTLLHQHLSVDPKNRAENLMIVDLIRNDLAKICRQVVTPSLFDVESYQTLLQMTSRVEGIENHTALPFTDIFTALFPCGSITGAPKVEAMRNILARESSPRGVYCGAIGHITPQGDATFSVGIRTLTLGGGTIRYGAGGGIVWDSEPESEHRECLLKTLCVTAEANAHEPDLQIIETLRWQNGFPRLNAHLKRLSITATKLGFEFHEIKTVQALQEATAVCTTGSVWRVRLLLSMNGELNIESTTLEQEDLVKPLRFGLASTHTHSADPFLYLKTTRRMLYQNAREAAIAADLDEVVFCNEKGELTEGSTTNLFLKQGNHWYTPPLCCGVLAGIMRNEMIGSGLKAREKRLYPNDLLSATDIRLSNAVRGSVPGIFVPAARL